MLLYREMIRREPHRNRQTGTCPRCSTRVVVNPTPELYEELAAICPACHEKFYWAEVTSTLRVESCISIEEAASVLACDPLEVLRLGASSEVSIGILSPSGKVALLARDDLRRWMDNSETRPRVGELAVRYGGWSKSWRAGLPVPIVWAADRRRRVSMEDLLVERNDVEWLRSNRK